MTRYAVLLKGLNIGGKRLPMPELKAFLEAQGGRDVRTLLASGNAVMTGDDADARALEERLERAAGERLALRTDWLVRSAAELAAVVAADPFPDAARERPSQYAVIFHRAPVPQTALDALVHGGPERLQAHGRELYVDYAGRLSDSRLPQAMARARFPSAATARNWNTVLKLRDATA